jgi:3-deoxy-D-manno-octulosonate 8-phosphate phosphatase (KDO 8-P phosphatase)
MFKEMCSKIKIIVSEVDGIITEGLNPIDNLNQTNFKFYYFRDFEAINLLKKDYKFVFLSSDNNVSYNIMRERNIPFFWARKSKKETLVDIMRRYDVGPEGVLYIGCTYSDIECINMIPLSVCPNDSAPLVKRVIGSRHELYDGILDIFGGGGVISEVYESLVLTNRK